MMVPKFRAWDADSKKYWNIENWHVEDEYVDLIEPNDSNANPNAKRTWKRESDVVIEQSTGLKDSNGKKIYVGDIVKSSYKYAQPKISQVIMEDGNSYILGEDLATGNEMLVSNYINEIEVIGNVHENLYLLGAQHE
jgi:uncharacterized phage protein (TIGR01671 family)